MHLPDINIIPNYYYMVVLSGTAPESSRYLRKEFINLLAFFKLQNQNLIDEMNAICIETDIISENADWDSRSTY